MKRSEDTAAATRQRKPVVWTPGGGRVYDMGRIGATFKADEGETAGQYSISEWRLEPHTKGPGAHSHSEDDVFFVLEGTMTVLVGAEWIEAPAGSFVLVPGGVVHDFENRSPKPATLLNFYPGEFEPDMKDIAAWFREHPPGDTRKVGGEGPPGER
jgi:quercetin dioxygenase-like cupin family protein